MFVYIVLGRDATECYILGVFSNQAAAKRYINDIGEPELAGFTSIAAIEYEVTL
jgi:hypothetical protein